MEQFSGMIHPGPSLPGCERIFADAAASGNGPFELHFNHNEELFLRLPGPFSVPSFPIHHDVRDPRPSAEYLLSLGRTLEGLRPLLPGAFRALRCFFDPSDVFHPGFFKVHRVEGSPYLFVMRLDLSYRPAVHRRLRPGDNDRTAEYESRDLYLESEFIPLASVEGEDGPDPAFRIDELVSQTWIGETGKGYMIKGIWMDSDLSRFFTKLFLPEGLSLYPYFPLACKYRTVCASPLRFDPEGRLAELPAFHRKIEFLRPCLPLIQEALKRSDFSDTMPEFAELRRRVPQSWLEPWTGPRLKAYLNEADLKEYLVEY